MIARSSLILLALAAPSLAQATPIRVAIENGASTTATASALAAQLNDDTWYDFTATVVTASGIDSAAELANYDVVILGDSGFNAVDWTAAMANALSAWTFAGGGGVVSVGWVDWVTAPGAAVLTTIDDVQPIDSYSYHYSYCSGGSSTLSTHAITTGVTSPLPAGANHIEGSPYASDATNGQVIGTSSCGTNSVVVGEYGAGRTVYLGHVYMAQTSYNNSSLRSGDWDRLLEQAVAWAAFGADTDGDGIVNGSDNCPAVANPTQADSDGDGVGDACDLCVGDDAFGDADGDLSCADEDCDDGDDTVYPGATELCDGQLNDCDSSIGSGEVDVDLDGYVVCALDSGGWDGSGTVVGGDDCDDGDDTVFPGAPELCDGQLNDCDGSIGSDELDGDGDGYAVCSLDGGGWDGGGTVVGGDDCDDGDDTVFPGAPELCDGQLNDCDGSIGSDEVDGDGDGYAVCSLDGGGWDGSGTVVGGDDCLDSDATVYPGATELCDGQDNDCDGSLPVVEVDGDVDGFVDCTVDGGGWDASAISGGEDCDDGDDTVYPGAVELCDGQDNDCDGGLPAVEVDGDVDGFVDCAVDGGGWDGSAITGGEDCDDGDLTRYPGALELCDGLDNDCDGSLPTVESDADTDLYVACVFDAGGWDGNSSILGDEDCDDGDPSIHPGALEIPYDAIDQDCDGADVCDADGDGFDSVTCTDGDDCDDDDDSIFPGAEELWYDGIDQDCAEDSDYDADGDGFDSESYGGEDCDDAEADTYPGAPDIAGDGIINDCDDSDEYDADGDGYDSVAWGGDDCDDANSTINPGADETWYDGVDQDCDGNDDDQDGDGFAQDVDCDDTDAAVFPGSPGLDEDCATLDSGLDGGPDTGGASGVYGGGTDCKGCASGGSAPVGGLVLGGLLGLAVLRRRR